MLSSKEKKRRQHEKELKSLRNKMGKSIIWFDALNKTQQYDLLFRWKKEKNRNNLIIPNWNIWIPELEQQKGCEKIELNRGQYLSDVLNIN
jgi:hypothetical protein